MSISANTVRWATQGAGSTVNVTLDQLIWNNTDVAVYAELISTGVQTLLTLTDDYTISGLATSSAIVTTVATYASTYNIIVYRVAVLTQEEDLVSGDPFPSTTIETILDKIVADTQVINDNGRRAIKWAVTSALRDLELADPAENASKLIAVNSAGTGFNYVDNDATNTDADLADLLSSSGFGTKIYPLEVQVGSTGIKIVSGSGTPEASITANIGSIYMRTNGATLTALYVKVSGAGNTGWRQILNADDTSGNIDLSAGTITTTGATSVGALTATSISTAGTALKTKIVDFTAWDMDSAATKTVAHGLTAANIKSATGVVFNNAGTAWFPIGGFDDTPPADVIAFGKAGGSGPSGAMDATNVYLVRGSDFDLAAYNAAYGSITITYEA